MKLKAMLLSLCLVACLCISVRAQSGLKPASFGHKTLTMSFWLQNMFYWRGAPISVFSLPAAPVRVPSPLMIAEALYGGAFKVGIWTGYTFDRTGYRNVSYYFHYTVSQFTFELWDSFTLINPKTLDYFDFDNASTQHFIDLSVGYKLKKIPLDFYLASMIYGRDGAVVNGSYSNRYSTYFRANYLFSNVVGSGVDVNIYASVGGALNNIDNTSFYGTYQSKGPFGVTEIGIGATKKFKFSDKYTLPFSVGLVASPYSKRVDGIIILKIL